jgi:hypothetical protein
MILYEVKDFRLEALNALNKEVQKRSLTNELQKIIETQIRSRQFELSDAEIKALLNKVFELPCPYCGQKKQSLNASEVCTVMSFISPTFTTKFLLIGCADCLAKPAKSSLLKSILLGWWGLKGLIATPQAIGINLRTIKRKQPSKTFMKLIKDNVSYIKSNSDDAEKLYLLISDPKFLSPREYDLNKQVYYSKIGSQLFNNVNGVDLRD